MNQTRTTLEAVDRLHGIAPVGTTIYTITRSDHSDSFLIVRDGKIESIDTEVILVLGRRCATIGGLHAGVAANAKFPGPTEHMVSTLAYAVHDDTNAYKCVRIG